MYLNDAIVWGRCFLFENYFVAKLASTQLCQQHMAKYDSRKGNNALDELIPIPSSQLNPLLSLILLKPRI